jgi:hypothetical protein
LTPDQEPWAEALAIEGRHGSKAPVFIAERIGAAALARDEAAIQQWKEIAGRLDQLMTRPAVEQ